MGFVDEVKRLAAEYDECETAWTQEWDDRLLAASKAVGRKLHAIDGVILMKFTIEVYTPAWTHTCFDRAFNGIGDWLA